MKKQLFFLFLLIAFQANCKSQENAILNQRKILFVIDGKPVQKNQVDQLDENDVVLIVVIKGKNAKSLYGRKAKKGVVLITTKKEAIKTYHRNLSVFSKDYSKKIKTVENEDNLLYVINNEPILEYRESKLFKLDPKKIVEIKIIDSNTAQTTYGIDRSEGAVVIKTK